MIESKLIEVLRRALGDLGKILERAEEWKGFGNTEDKRNFKKEITLVIRQLEAVIENL